MGRTFALATLTLALQGCLMEQVARNEGARPASQPTAKTAKHPSWIPVWLTGEEESVGAADGQHVDILNSLSSSGNTWDRIRAGFKLPGRDRPEVADEVAWFADHQKYLDRVTERAALYLPMVLETIESRGLPTELALLPILESAYEPLATSPSNAAGLWQFIPETGKRFGLRQSFYYDGRRDITESTRAALEYLANLHDRFEGDWLLALAAYNWGEGNVERAMDRNRSRGKSTDFWSLDTRKETRTYVPRLLALAEVIGNPDRYGIALRSVDDAPVLAAVNLNAPIDLKLAAKLADVEVEELRRYNPAYHHGTTDPHGPHTLLLPSEKVEEFSARLAQLPQDQWVRTRYHQVRKGETLAAIASKYWLSEEQLRSANSLAGRNLRPGATLVIPESSGMLARAPATESKVADAKAKPGPAKREYLVKSGDTLWTIAKTQNVGVKELQAWNHLGPKDQLQPGRKLVVAASPHSAEMTVPTRKIGYTVQKGDSLARIAERFQVSVDDLRRWNEDVDGKLTPGKELTLYVAKDGKS